MHGDPSEPMDYSVLKIKNITFLLNIALKLFGDDAIRTVLGRVFHCFGAD